MKWVVAFMCLVFAAWIAGCGGVALSTGTGTPGVYLIDQGNNRLVWMSDMGAGGTSSLFDSAITGITNVTNGTVDTDGRIYLIDGTNHSVVRFDNLAGDNRSEFGVGTFQNPVRVAVDSNQRMYVVDRGQNLLIRMDANGGNVLTLDLSPWFAAADEPAIVFDHAGHILLAGGSTVVRLTGFTGTGAQTFGAAGSGVGQFNGLTGIAVDLGNGIYLADGGNDRIVRMNDITGAGWVAYGVTGAGVGQFDIPFGIAVDDFYRVYVSDRNNQRLVRMDSMAGANWTEMSGPQGGGLFSFPLNVFVHLPG